jgi:hypothetical protein
MATWWSEWLASGFTASGPDLPKALFRIVFAAGLLLKFGVETRRGGLTSFELDTFPYFLHRVRLRRLALPPAVYRGFYLLQPVAALALLVGWQVRGACALLVLAMGVRSVAELKNNTSLAILFAAAFALSPDGGQTLGLSALIAHGGDVAAWLHEAERTSSSNFGRGLVVLTMGVAYVTTAIRKMNPVFLSGAAVYAPLQLAQRERGRRYHRDGWFPAWFLRGWVFADEATLQRRWRPLMWLTVALELVLPFALLSPATAPYAAVAGVGLHVGFASINPVAIAHFSLFSIAAYLLFF